MGKEGEVTCRMNPGNTQQEDGTIGGLEGILERWRPRNLVACIGVPEREKLVGF